MVGSTDARVSAAKTAGLAAAAQESKVAYGQEANQGLQEEMPEIKRNWPGTPHKEEKKSTRGPQRLKRTETPTCKAKKVPG